MLLKERKPIEASTRIRFTEDILDEDADRTECNVEKEAAAWWTSSRKNQPARSTPRELAKRYYTDFAGQYKVMAFFTSGGPARERFRFAVCEPCEIESEFEETAEQFHNLAKKWREEIGAESSLSKITSNMNYLRIISLGKDVIPFILEDLKKEPSPWFVALRAITGEFNIGKAHSGNFKRIAEEWINWGKQNGYF